MQKSRDRTHDGQIFGGRDFSVRFIRHPNLPRTRNMTFFRSFVLFSRQRPNYLPLTEARLFSRQLGITSVYNWRKWSASGSRPPEIPSNPDKVYRRRSGSWISWIDFLGLSSSKSQFLSHEQAREYVQRLQIRGVRDYAQWSKSSQRPKNIPANPRNAYQSKGWVSWYHFLGYEPPERDPKETRPRLAESYHQTMLQDAHHVRECLRKNVIAVRPDIELISLPFGMDATHLFRIAGNAPAVVAGASGADTKPQTKTWVPLRLRFSRCYHLDCRRHNLRMNVSNTDVFSIVVTDEGRVFFKEFDGLCSGRKNRTVYLRSKDAVEAEVVPAQLDYWWGIGRHQTEADWRRKLCTNLAQRTWAENFGRLQSTWFCPSGLTSWTPGETGEAPLVVDGRRAILRSAYASRGSFKATISIGGQAARGGRLRGQYLTESDNFSLLMIAMPISHLPRAPEDHTALAVFIFPKGVLVDWGVIRRADGAGGVKTMMLYPPHLDLSTSDSVRLAKQQRQAPFYVSNMQEFQTLWRNLQSQGFSTWGDSEDKESD